MINRTFPRTARSEALALAVALFRLTVAGLPSSGFVKHGESKHTTQQYMVYLCSLRYFHNNKVYLYSNANRHSLCQL